MVIRKRKKKPQKRDKYLSDDYDRIVIREVAGIKRKCIKKLKNEYGMSVGAFLRLCMELYLLNHRGMIKLLHGNHPKIKEHINPEDIKKVVRSRKEAEKVRQMFNLSKEDYIDIFDHFRRFEEEVDLDEL